MKVILLNIFDRKVEEKETFWLGSVCGTWKIELISDLSKAEPRFNSEFPTSEKIMETTGFLAVVLL